MAATHTTNLGLNKPDRQDLVSVVSDINDNMDMIDTAVGNLDTDKVNISDIIDNLTTNDPSKPLSAAQGYTLNSNLENLHNSTALANVDLNNYKTTTTYRIGNLSNITNAPSGIGSSGVFMVDAYGGYVLQRLYMNEGNATRLSFDGGTTWNSWEVTVLNSKLKTRVVQGTTNSTGALWTGISSNNFILGQKMNTNANLDVQGYVAYSGSWYLQSVANTSVDMTVIYKEP